jgi:hypothetical protein
MSYRCLLSCAAVLALVQTLPAQTEKKKVEKADDLPRHTYKVGEAPSALLLDDAPFAALASAVRKDLDDDLAAYDVEDHTTLQAFTGTELAQAMLDRDYAGTLGLVARLRALQDKPSEKLTSALTAEAWARAHIAHPSPEGFDEAFRSALAAEVKALPWDLVQDDIKSVKGSMEIRSQSLLVDIQASVDSPEAAELKKFMATLKPDQVKATLENLELVVNYVHGSHVTGIATEGNPFAQVVIGRITFDYHMIPEVPTLEQSRKNAVEYAAVVDYFRRNGVRVVNMSWGGALKDDEDALEANGAGGTAEERKKLARQIFDIDSDGLRAALQGAPGILFVVAAGNSNNNVKFDEVTPSSFQLPNMITVGAVDQAGEETSFSSFGPMVNVHANGFEVESYVPGGRRIKLSGTSMASPQVTNLGAKLFALDPALTPEEAKQLILDGCDRNGRVNLVSEVKSIALLRARLAAN